MFESGATREARSLRNRLAASLFVMIVQIMKIRSSKN